MIISSLILPVVSLFLPSKVFGLAPLAHALGTIPVASTTSFLVALSSVLKYGAELVRAVNEWQKLKNEERKEQLLSKETKQASSCQQNG